MFKIEREIDKIICECSGGFKEIEPLTGFETKGCSLRAFECVNCTMVFTVFLNPPEKDGVVFLGLE